MINISRASNGEVTFDLGVGVDPIVLSDSNNIVVSSNETKNSQGTITGQYLSFMRSNPYFFYAVDYSQIGTINGSAKPAIGSATTDLFKTAVFQGIPSGGDIPIGTDRQVLGYDGGDATPVTLGWKQLSDLPTPPTFSNGVLTGTAFASDGSALFAFVELALGAGGTSLVKPNAIPFYNPGQIGTGGGTLAVANAISTGDAVNLSQLNGRLSVNQRTAINALVAATATTADIVNALKAL